MRILTLALMIFVFQVSAASAAEWYEGGTLHGAGILEWQKASQKNKLATSADFSATAWQKGMLKADIAKQISSPDDLKPLANGLTKCIDAAAKPERNAKKNKQLYANQTVAEFASLCLVTMGLVK